MQIRTGFPVLDGTHGNSKSLITPQPWFLEQSSQFDSVRCTFAMAISHLAGGNWGFSGLESAKRPRTGVPKIPFPGVKPNYGFPSWWSLPIPVSLTQHVET
ncbi:MAG: hypothetical protein DWI00_01545 [Planctomycetota bacterium]|nr:MAG: hypothetical protein DWI00_01545 [Planctomycetota bacterium]